MKKVDSFYVLRGKNVVTDFEGFRGPTNGEFNFIFPEIREEIEIKIGTLHIGGGKSNIVFSEDFARAILRNAKGTLQVIVNFTPEFTESRRRNAQKRAEIQSKAIESLMSFSGWLRYEVGHVRWSANDRDEYHHLAALFFEGGVCVKQEEIRRYESSYWAGDLGNYADCPPTSETSEEIGEKSEEDFHFSATYTKVWGAQYDDIHASVKGVWVPVEEMEKALHI